MATDSHRVQKSICSRCGDYYDPDIFGGCVPHHFPENSTIHVYHKYSQDEEKKKLENCLKTFRSTQMFPWPLTPTLKSKIEQCEPSVFEKSIDRNIYYQYWVSRLPHDSPDEPRGCKGVFEPSLLTDGKCNHRNCGAYCQGHCHGCNYSIASGMCSCRIFLCCGFCVECSRRFWAVTNEANKIGAKDGCQSLNHRTLSWKEELEVRGGNVLPDEKTSSEKLKDELKQRNISDELLLPPTDSNHVDNTSQIIVPEYKKPPKICTPLIKSTVQVKKADKFLLGDHVKLKTGGVEGQILYIGIVDFASGVWIGIVVPQGCGQHNGKVAGKRYFYCEWGRGLLVNPRELLLISHAAPAKRNIINKNCTILSSALESYYGVGSSSSATIEDKS